MANGGAMAVTISVNLDTVSMEELIAQIQSQLSQAGVSLDIKTTQAGQSTSLDIAQSEQNQNGQKELAEQMKKAKETVKSMILGENNAQSEESQKQIKALAVGQQVANTLATKTQGFVQQSFGILEMIYGKLKEASPLLQTIESLFNLAMTLFFMPLGNKLAEVLLPAVLELVDGVVEMWDALEGKSLTEIVEYMMEYGVQLFADFFYDIADILVEQGGLLGSIGELMNQIGSFLETSAYSVLNFILSAVTFVVSHLKEIISLIVAFYAMQYTMQLMSMYVNAVGQTIAGKWLGAGVIAAGVATGATAYLALGALGMAEGGYVPATEGGQWKLLGEGGEGEYVIPESKMADAMSLDTRTLNDGLSDIFSEARSGLADAMSLDTRTLNDGLSAVGGTTNNYYYINGYTSDDVVRLIRDEVSSQISQSRIRGSFRWSGPSAQPGCISALRTVARR